MSSAPKIQPNDYVDFLNSNLTPHHFITNSINQAKEKGFVEHPSTTEKLSPGKYYIVNGTMIYLLIVPEKIITTSIIAVHIDSPLYKLKPNFIPENIESKDNDLISLAIEKYGGLLRHTFYDRELILAGKIIDQQGKETIIGDEEDIIAFIPSLPPHLNDNTYSVSDFKYENLKAFTAPQYLENLIAIKNESLSFDLSLLPKQKAFYDKKSKYVFSGRHDNLSSSFAALRSILDSEENEKLQIAAFYDYEEIGSLDRSGAESISLNQILNQFDIKEGTIVSADAAHAYNPGYSGNYENNHRSNLGDGVVVKFSPTYSTEINSAFFIKKLAYDNGIPTINFSNANHLRGGSTIGSMMSASTNLKTVDIGIPLFAMHSSREIVSFEDLSSLKDLFDAFLK